MHINAQILARSGASASFQADLHRYIERREDVPGIALTNRVPRIKVLRLIHHLLDAHPELAVDRLIIEAQSGCSDFVGTVTVEGGGESRQFEFLWDCRWRAEQEGWTDAFGFPDQIRAAETFEWRCFAQWEEGPPTSGERAG